MNNSKIIEIFEALLDGYMPSTGESIENNLIINDRLVVRSLQSAIFRLQDKINKKDKAELYKNEVNNLPIIKNINDNSQILEARKKNLRAYEPWIEKEDSILEDLVKLNFSIKQISEILERGQGAIKSRIIKQEFKTEALSTNNLKEAEETFEVNSIKITNVDKVKFNQLDNQNKVDNGLSTTNSSEGSNKLVTCIYCKDSFPIERLRLGYNYCVRCSSENSKTFVDKGFQTREGHKIMNSKGYRNSKNK